MAVGAHGPFLYPFDKRQLQQPCHTAAFEHRFASLLQRFSVSITPLPLFVGVQLFHVRLRLGQTLAQGFGHGLGLLHRTHGQMAFCPGVGLASHFMRQGDVLFVAFGDQLCLARCVFTVDRGRNAAPFPDRLQVTGQHLVRQLLLPQGTQVIVALSLDERARPQRRHFGVTHIQQAVLVQTGAHLLDGRNVEPIIGSFPRNHLGRHGQPQRVQRRQHHFQLGQVRDGGLCCVQT